MKTVFSKNICMIIAVIFTAAISQPNFIETTIFDVNGVPSSGKNLVTTNFSDGLGRSIESKTRLLPDGVIDRDRVSCTFYDESGRPKYATKPFVDTRKAGTYLPGTISDNGNIDNDIEQNLFTKYTDTHAFSENSYWDDPLGRARIVTGPGAAYSGDYSRSWTIGVCVADLSNHIVVKSSTTLGNLDFANGIITRVALQGDATLEMLFDALNDNFLTNNPFSSSPSYPTHFLTITLDAEQKISEQLTDFLGRTINTFSGPDIGAATGLKLKTTSTHDILGNVIIENPPVAASNPLTAFENRYNTLGQLEWKKSPDVDGEYLYEYEEDGRLKSVELRRNGSTKHLLNYSYDDFGRQTEIEEIRPPTTFRPVVQSYYDDIGKIPTELLLKIGGLVNRFENLSGRLVCSVAYNYVNQILRVINYYSYDSKGRVRFKATYIDGAPSVQEVWYEYDIHGKKTVAYSYYGNEIIKKKYKYDELGRLETIVHCRLNSDGSTVSEKDIAIYRYDDMGVLTTKNFPEIAADYNVGYEFDIRDRLTDITSPDAAAGFAEEIDGYDKAGNINSAHYRYLGPGASGSEFDMSYIYDDVYRLKTVRPAASSQNADYGCDYEYDAVGRFKSKKEGKSQISSYDYFVNSSRLQMTSRNRDIRKQFVYDVRGNVFIDMARNAIIWYDWRNLPSKYRFYDDLGKAAIDKNTTTGTFTNWLLESKVSSGEVKPISSVAMLYDASGNRVGKIELQE